AINIAGGEIMLNKNVDAFVRVFLNFLYSIFPLKYGQNLVNYSEFKSYFSGKKIDQTIRFLNFDNLTGSVNADAIWVQIKKGFGETKIRKWIKD
ncbi:MAG: hypothetical protein WC872_04450, partial [Candidatus Absconditabacterales bacterium]